MKLIIDIPEEDYEFTKGAKTARVFPSEYYVKLILNGTPLSNDSDRAEAQAYFYGQTYGWEQGRKALIEDVKAEFINSYPKNYMGEPELGGATCHFSLNKVLNILDRTDTAESEDK